MSGYISEFFGYKAEDKSREALQAVAKKVCPFLNSQCTKILSSNREASGVWAVKQKKEDSPGISCCPNRLYAEDYKILKLISNLAFKKQYNLYAGRVAIEKAKTESGAVAIFGHGWGGELRLPQRKGSGSYFVDWVLAKLDDKGELEEFTAIEVQTIDTTGNYQTARKNLLEKRAIVSDTVGLNWENVSKRIIPQIIYKGQVLQREDLCKTGLYFVCPQPIYERVITRLGGIEKLPKYPVQPASIHFVSYDYQRTDRTQIGKINVLDLIAEHCTTVYKIQEAFSALDLPEGNVYRDAIKRSLYG
jgi:hypothetical protein